MSMSRRLSGRAGSADGGDRTVLSRNNSLTGLTEDVIKSATQRFDLEIVFKLTWINRGLTRISSVDKCINLVELNLSGNQITKIEGLDATPALRRLVLTSNRLTRLEGLAHLARLEGLWLQDNRLAALDSLALPEQLARLPGLRALYLQNVDRSAPNPVCRAAGYKAALLAALPGLSNLDGERSPHSLNYAELAAEWEAARAAPPPPRVEALPLPAVAPWLAEGAAGAALAGVGAGGGQGEAELQKRHAKASKSIDECEALARALGHELDKFAAALRAKAAEREEGAAAAGAAQA